MAIQYLSDIEGAAGTLGLTGATGPSGSATFAGATGSTGPIGATGYLGPQGTTGPQGIQGIQGTSGTIGYTGSSGATGPLPTYAAFYTAQFGQQIGATGATGSVQIIGGLQVGTGATGATGSVNASGIGSFSGGIYAPGAVIQVQHKILNAATSVSIPLSYNTYTDIPNHNVSITPKYTNSKMVITVNWGGEHSNVNSSFNGMFGLKRNGTAIGFNTTGGAAQGLAQSTLTYYGADQDSTPEYCTFTYVDLPNTVSAVTYQVYFCTSSIAETLYSQRCVNASTGPGYELPISSITVMEIAQ
jgi:hypothetical protein